MPVILVNFFSGLSNLILYTIPIFIDRKFRHFDHFLNNAYHPYRKKWAISGHGPSILIVIVYTLCTSLYGPTWDAVMGIFPSLYDTAVSPFTWKNYVMLLFLVALIVCVLLFTRFHHKGQHVRVFHIVLMGAIALFIFCFADPEATEADNTLYFHGFFLFGLLLLIFAWIAKGFAYLLLKQFIIDNKQKMQKVLIETELFEKPKKPEFLHSKIFYAVISALTHYPLHILLLPSLVILFLKDVGSSSASYWIIGLALFLAFMLSFWGSLHSRWNNMFQLITRITMRGGMLVVSVLVIALAIARLLNVSYITTVMDGTPLSLIPYVAAFYFYFLAYEYWANRSFNEVLMPIFGKPCHYGCIQFNLNQQARGKGITVAAKNRALQLHGIDRFLVTGLLENKKKERYGYEAYTRQKLFSRLLEKAIGQGDEKVRTQAIAIQRRLRRLSHIYFSSLNILLILTVIIFFWMVNVKKEREPIWEVNANTSSINFSLSDALHRQFNQNSPAILMASSGGGTRAALYTSSILYGLHKLGVADDVVMGSGVSGGGVSLAYFAYHRAALTEDKSQNFSDFICDEYYGSHPDVFTATTQDQLWKCYFEKVSRPFIKDVIQGSAELRIAAEATNGILLSESLARNFADQSAIEGYPANMTFSQLKHFGLMLNTALVAHPYHYSKELSEQYAGKPVDKERFYTVYGGGRMVFTNLNEVEAFPNKRYIDQQVKDLDTEDIFLKYNIIQDGAMPLTVAGALNANFPPVFSNSLVRVNSHDGKGSRRVDDYFVTDGGAIENRGVISLLYALKSGLIRYQDFYPSQCLPDINLIVAEASASAIDYNNNRGLETALGGSLPIAHQLYRELLNDVKAVYSKINESCTLPARQDNLVQPQKGELRVHYLAMPRVFRTRGGMGTHWMMPSRVGLSDPREPDPKIAIKEAYFIDRRELESLLAALYVAPEKCSSILVNRRPQVRHAICEWLVHSKSQAVWEGLKSRFER